MICNIATYIYVYCYKYVCHATNKYICVYIFVVIHVFAILLHAYMYIATNMYITLHIYIFVACLIWEGTPSLRQIGVDSQKSLLHVSLDYGVASVSRIDKILGLFCKRALQTRLYSAKETCIFSDPTNRSHPIA